ncbi:unnamed protein product [Parajaminaea phylloscopi]
MWKTKPPVGRIEPRLRPVVGTLKVLLASNVVTALIIGYALSLKVFHINTFGFGLYFLFISTDFLVQFSCAIYNRRRVNVIAKRTMSREQKLRAVGITPRVPRIIVTAVGYREDGEAWKKCLGTLDVQQIMPQGIICCVDGNDAPDLEMAQQFQEAYADRDHRVVHLEKTLASVYKDAYEASLHSLRSKPRTRWDKFKWWVTSIPYPEETASHLYARKTLYAHMTHLHEQHDFTRCYRTLYTQPHGDKRTAMFTAFAISLYLGAEAVFATDSDTLLEPSALQEMWMLLDSDPNYGAVTADVKIENWRDSFISLQSRLRYWMAFNIERACQSTFRCVTCISGPMALYRACDLDAIIGMWLCQSFLGVHTTFGDDRHLTNCLLGKGLKTAYTHRTCCHSESPSSFIRWIRQQTRWSKSFYREAIWFPRAFAYGHIWLGVETMKQGLYPFILLATVLNILYGKNPWLRLVTWAGTMFGTAAFKGFLAWIISKDWRMILFPGYPLLYFFGLLPSKILALSTMGKTNWGTSARTASERSRGESFGQKSWHVGHLAFFYITLITGLAHFLVHITGIVWLWFVPAAATIPVIMLYWDELPFKYWILAIKDRKKGKKAVDITQPARVSVLFGPAGESPFALVPNSFPSSNASFATTLVGVDGKVLKDPFSSRSSISLRPEASLTSEQILGKPRILQPCSRSSSGYEMVPQFSPDAAVPVKGAFYQQPGQDYSYVATPPYPPPATTAHARKSTLDILESGQGWPNLPPPVVSAKGAWVWQPATPSLKDQAAESMPLMHGGLGSELRLPFSRKPSWVETPPTPGSEAPPYPASACHDGTRSSGGADSPFATGSYRGDWARQHASGRGSGILTPDSENPFVYSSADEYASRAASPGRATPRGKAAQLGVGGTGGDTSHRSSRSFSFQNTCISPSASHPLLQRGMVRASGSSFSSDRTSLSGMPSYPQPPARSSRSHEQNKYLHPLSYDWSSQSRAPSPVTSLLTFREENGGADSPSSSQFHVLDEYGPEPCESSDEPSTALLSKTKFRGPQRRSVAYADPFAAPRGRYMRQVPEKGSTNYRLSESEDELAPLAPEDHSRKDAQSWGNTMDIEEDWLRRGCRTTTYGGLIDVYALSGEDEEIDDIIRQNHELANRNAAAQSGSAFGRRRQVAAYW